MGCALSKRSQDTVDVYRPAPSSFAVFDVTSIEEPWLKDGDESEDVVVPDNKKPSHVPAFLLEKLNAIEDAPRSWDEVSKELEDLKPKLNKLRAPQPAPKKPNPTPPPAQFNSRAISKPRLPRKSFSFNTLSELDSKPAGLKRVDSVKPDLKRSKSGRVGSRVDSSSRGPESANGYISEVPKSLKENMFIVRDRQEREN